jgi:hypothetical protein
MLHRWFSVAALTGGLFLLAPTAGAADKDEGFKDLFNGKSFEGWKFVLAGKEAEPGKTFTIKDGIIIVSGQPNGYLVTDKSYKNYVLKYDWQYKRPDGLEDEEKFLGNSGCLVHVQGLPAKGTWPKCVEVQGMNRDHAKLLGVSGAKVMDAKFDGEALKKARHKVGEWNTTEIICKADGTIEALVNGTKISSGKSELTEGPIGWQSEGAEIHFRNIKLKEMK